jgi:sulfoxide reductase heme-binding subunit YedZ
MVTAVLSSAMRKKSPGSLLMHLLERNMRWLVHLFALLPLGLLLRDFLTKNLTVNPIQAATQRTGDTALVMLLVSLACSPAVSILGIKGLLKFRRTLGLYAFFYAGLHFSIFLGLDYAFNLSLVWADFAEKRFILVGFLTGLILLVLAVTSFQWWMIRLRKGWKRLHRLVYLAGVLAVLHYLWAVKADIRLPLLAGGILLLLLLLRLPPIKRRLIGARQRWAAKFQLL